MVILAIDTSCDETAAAVTEGTKVLSNVIWSQASLHAKWGGILPSLAQREHKKRIDFVIEKALKQAFPKKQVPSAYLRSRPSSAYSLVPKYIDAIAVTIGPGLAVALEVGIAKAKELCKKYSKPLIVVNHVEGHVLSPLARPGISKSEFLNPKQIQNSKSQIQNELQITNYKFPSLAFVASGGTTQLILVKEIGKYEVLAQTIDDALGEALDKGARMLGLGYPGGAILEKIAKEGDSKSYSLPVPMIGQEDKLKFSYSGLKTALFRLIEKEKPLTKAKIVNLAASYQNVAFEHVMRIISYYLLHTTHFIHEFWFGGGVSANLELRKRIRKICHKAGIELYLPYSKKLCTDNAAMIGVAASFKFESKKFLKPSEVDKVERVPRMSLIKLR